MTTYTALGLMSGTSMDGIDAAILETDGEQCIKETANYSFAYPPAFQTLLKAAEYAVKNHQGDLQTANKKFSICLRDYLCKHLGSEDPGLLTLELAEYLCHDKNKSITLFDIIRHSTLLHVKVVKDFLQNNNITPDKIHLLGYHGQTLFHNPAAKITIQAGDGQLLADETKINVITDFRSNDVLHDGQGAPLVPLFHQALAIRDSMIPAVIINCGGIANITVIDGENYDQVWALDTGPGNVLLDRFVKLKTNGKMQMDENGAFAVKGKVDAKILERLYQQSCVIQEENYFNKLPPKSLDSHNLILIPEMNNLSLEDGCATLAAFTAKTIIDSALKIIKHPNYRWILCGGGAKNPVILREMQNYLLTHGDNPEIFSCAALGWNEQALEAQAFAYLAVRSLKQLPLSIPNTTGVNQPVSGGALYKPTIERHIGRS